MTSKESPAGKGIANPRYRDLVGQLVAARKSMGLSQAALAALLNRHQQFVSRYETGERRLDVVEFVDVARALGCDPAQMIEPLVS
ncbi:helix-turn-helix domain-containing protein [Sphingomonas sp. PL-96]|uniref:helix-turn-helix domain-containing protein n=1 Tax=Sphingomonas sp. PL-96 TaxID=2887201 RepID=UPI00226C9F7E|nr:helix-turn-helix transcriptional regulator [Sphingomonas sp. PL-96]MCC2977810.1 helix-turn-helix domain-containing protein [Sphingomonas sp. PL-96]